jgi:hypothetical protein
MHQLIRAVGQTKRSCRHAERWIIVAHVENQGQTKKAQRNPSQIELPLCLNIIYSYPPTLFLLNYINFQNEIQMVFSSFTEYRLLKRLDIFS